MVIRIDWCATVFAAALLVTAGCAIHHFDPATGTEHIWGFGHLKMKSAVANEGLKAIVRGTDTLGISVGRGDDKGYLTLGWSSHQTLDIVSEDTAVRLEWPSSDFFSIRVGSELPVEFAPDDATGENPESEESKP